MQCRKYQTFHAVTRANRHLQAPGGMKHQCPWHLQENMGGDFLKTLEQPERNKEQAGISQLNEGGGFRAWNLPVKRFLNTWELGAQLRRQKRSVYMKEKGFVRD